MVTSVNNEMFVGRVTVNREGLESSIIEQIEKLFECGPIAEGIESTSETLALFPTRHPQWDGDAFPLDDEVEEGYTAIFYLPVDGALAPEKRVKRVFDLDGALVAGIKNRVLANAATVDIAWQDLWGHGKTFENRIRGCDLSCHAVP